MRRSKNLCTRHLGLLLRRTATNGAALLVDLDGELLGPVDGVAKISTMARMTCSRC